MIRRLSLPLFATLAVFAQDQTVIISKPPALCTAVGAAASAQLNPAQAATLIANVLGAPPDEDTYYIIHDVRYVDGQFAIDQQHWYVYYAGWVGPSLWQEIKDTRINHHFKEARIYGSHKVALVYIHNNIPGTTMANALSGATAVIPAVAADPGPPPRPAQTAAERANALIVEKLIRGNEGASNLNLIDAATNHTLAGIGTPASGGGVIDAAFKDLQSLTYKITITKEVPAPIQNLQGIAGLISAQGAPTDFGITIGTVSVCGGRTFNVTPLPSQMTVTATTGSGTKQTELSKNTADNEKKYWYDFSLALPLKSYNDLTVNSADFTLTAKKAQKQNLFALVNLSPFPYDTKKAQFQLLPVFLYGMPITGHPLNHHLFAAAIGLNRVQFFAGVMLNHNHLAPITPISGAQTSTATSQGSIQDKWGTHLSYGINFPVSTVVNLLKSNSSSSKK